ncbi:hypothetical protein [Leadbettera azotonutricia]|uniref:Uncharacterized protein n=1 Tax=Leadbettera azotonutricia (strain ATCC BAA-888 / DSM 13862 / ZAS-9) TaxID=545695 RepID=F5YDG0_LEAAZ|nr:hypothetical protein [Leadbettera azotonutricia]AEF81008.1 hypothetical protein TREAZ_0368 [Leadbettera azotonutricia ZAS-9]
MKPKVVFTVLMAVFCLFGLTFCSDDPSGNSGNPDVPNEVADAFEAIGAEDFVVPSGGSYHSYYMDDNSESLSVLWTNCSKSIFDQYVSAWQKKLGEAPEPEKSGYEDGIYFAYFGAEDYFPSTEFTTFWGISIIYFPYAINEEGIPANSILLELPCGGSESAGGE